MIVPKAPSDLQCAEMLIADNLKIDLQILLSYFCFMSTSVVGYLVSCTFVQLVNPSITPLTGR